MAASYNWTNEAVDAGDADRMVAELLTIPGANASVTETLRRLQAGLNEVRERTETPGPSR